MPLQHFLISMPVFGKGNGKVLQCSRLENPGTEEPGGLRSMGSCRVGHGWSDLAAAAAAACPFLASACSDSYLISVYMFKADLCCVIFGNEFSLMNNIPLEADTEEEQ